MVDSSNSNYQSLEEPEHSVAKEDLKVEHFQIINNSSKIIIHNMGISAWVALVKMLTRLDVKEVEASNHLEWWAKRKKELQFQMDKIAILVGADEWY